MINLRFLEQLTEERLKNIESEGRFRLEQNEKMRVENLKLKGDIAFLKHEIAVLESNNPPQTDCRECVLFQVCYAPGSVTQVSSLSVNPFLTRCSEFIPKKTPENDPIDWEETAKAQKRKICILNKELKNVTEKSKSRGLEIAKLSKILQEKKTEIEVTDKLLAEQYRLMDHIPECETHGNRCVPSAIEWVTKAKESIETEEKPKVYCDTCRHSFDYGKLCAKASVLKDGYCPDYEPERRGR